MRKSIRIYESAADVADCYTAIDMRRRIMAVPDGRRGMTGLYDAIGFNAEPFAPQGFGQHTTAMPGAHLGRRIELDALPPDARKFVEQFASEV